MYILVMEVKTPQMADYPGCKTCLNNDGRCYIRDPASVEEGGPEYGCLCPAARTGQDCQDNHCKSTSINTHTKMIKRVKILNNNKKNTKDTKDSVFLF